MTRYITILLLFFSLQSNAQNYIETLINGIGVKQQVDNISGLKSGNFKVGQTINTSGYYNSLDGGSTTFVITNSGKTQNGGSIHTLNNGLTAEDVNANYVHVAKWGLTADGVTDNLSAWNNLTSSVPANSTVYFGRGEYYFSDEIKLPNGINIIGQGIGVDSETKLTFAINKNGIRVENNTGRHEIRNLYIQAESTVGTTGYGVYSNFVVDINNVHIRNFAEKGVYILTDAIGTVGNANGSSLRNVDIRFIGFGSNGIAFHLEGGNTNVCLIENCKALNVGNGFFQDEGSGNTYLSCQSQSVDDGGYHFKSTGSVNHTIFKGCYAEGEENSTIEIDPPSEWIGGTIGDFAGGQFANSGYLDYATATDKYHFGKRVFKRDDDVSTILGAVNKEFYRLTSATDAGQGNGRGWTMRYNLSVDGPTMMYDGVLAQTAYVLLTPENVKTFGRSSAVDYNIWFPYGLILGDMSTSGANARLIQYNNLAPSSGIYAAGDFVFSSTGNELGFLCIADGSPGTWSTLAAVTTSNVTDWNNHLSNDNDLSSTNEIELPVGGDDGDLLSTDGSGNYSWVASAGGSNIERVTKVTDISSVSSNPDVIIVEDQIEKGIFIRSTLNIANDNGIWMKDANSQQWTRQFTGAVNVRFYGATGDGTTDDYTAIQASINAAGNNGIPNHVYTPDGEYFITELIDLKDGIIFEGSGSTTTTFKIASTHTNSANTAFNGIVGAYGTSSVELYGIVIKNFGVLDGGTGQGTAINGIKFRYCQNFTIENIKVEGVTNYGIWAQESHEGVINNCYVLGAEESIEVSQGVSNINVTNNRVEAVVGETANMILIYGNAQNINVIGNHLEGQSMGIYVSSSTLGCNNIVMTDNHVSVSNNGGAIKYPIVLEGSSIDDIEGFIVKGGYLYSEDAQCIRLNSNNTTPVNDVMISNVVMNSPSDEAIDFSNSTDITNVDIKGCNITSPTGVIIGTATYSSFIGNTVNGGGTSCFVGGGNADYNKYNGNTLIDTYLSIGASCTVNDNQITGFSSSNNTIELYDDYNVVGNNRCIQRIRVFSDNNLVTSNLIEGGISTAAVTDTGTGNTLDNNVFF